MKSRPIISNQTLIEKREDVHSDDRPYDDGRVAEPPTLVGQLAQLLSQTGIIVPRGTVTHALAIGIDDTARPPLAHPVAGLEMSNSFALDGGRQNFFARRSFSAA